MTHGQGRAAAQDWLCAAEHSAVPQDIHQPHARGHAVLRLTAYTDYEMKREMSAAPGWMVEHMKLQRVQECNTVLHARKTEFNWNQHSARSRGFIQHTVPLVCLEAAGG